MRALHTQAWRIGRTFYGWGRTAEFRLFADWLARQARDREVDAVVIEGRLFEGDNASAEALSLFNDALRLLCEAREGLQILFDTADVCSAVKHALQPLPEDFDDEEQFGAELVVINEREVRVEQLLYEPLRERLTVEVSPLNNYKQLDALPERQRLRDRVMRREVQPIEQDGNDALPYVRVIVDGEPQDDALDVIKQRLELKAVRVCAVCSNRQPSIDDDHSEETSLETNPALIARRYYEKQTGHAMPDAPAKILAEAKRKAPTQQEGGEPDPEAVFNALVAGSEQTRALLLEQLTDTSVCSSVSRNVHEALLRAKTEFQLVQKQIDTLKGQLLGDAGRAGIETEISHKRNRLRATTDRLARAQKLLSWYAGYDSARQQQQKVARELREAQDRLNALQNDKRELDRYDYLLPLSKLYYDRKNISRSLAQAHAELGKAQAELQQLKEQETALKAEAQEAREAYLAARQNLERRQGDLDEGEQLDRKVSEQTERLHAEESRAEQQAQLVDKLTSQLEQNARLQTESSQEIRRLQTLLDSMSMHRQMIDNIEGIKARLGNIHLSRQELASVEAEAQKAEQTRKDAETQRLQLDREIDELRKQQSEQSEQREQLKRRNEVQNLPRVHDRIVELSTQRLAAQAAGQLWNLIAEGYKAINLSNNSLRDTRGRLDALRGKLQETEQKATRLVGDRDKLYKQLTLVQAADITELRKNLREGTPCPVCGSHHHPYHSEVEQKLGRLALQMQTDYEAADREMQAIQLQLVDLRTEVATLEGSIAQTTKELDHLLLSQEQYKKQWKTCESIDSRLEGCGDDINFDSRRIIIESVVNNATKELDEQSLLQQQIRQRMLQIDSLNHTIEQNARNLASKDEASNKLLALLTFQDRQLQQLQKRAHSLRGQISIAYNELSEKINLPAWHKEHAADHNSFCQKISDIATRYRETLRQQAHQQTLNTNALKSIETLKQALSNQQATLDGMRTLAANTKAEIADAEQRLKQLFGDKKPQQVKLDMTARRLSLEARAHDKQQSLEAMQSKIKTIEGRILSIERSTSLLRDRQKANQDALDTHINKMNSTGGSPVQYHELERYFEQQRDWNKLRATCDNAQRNLRDLQLEADRITASLNSMQGNPIRPDGSTGETQEVLRYAIPTDQQLRDELTKQIHAGEALLDHDLQLQQQIATLEPARQEAERNLQQHQQLDDLLGSPDGSKFRLIAQSATLTLLATRANKYLPALTRRYSLSVPCDTMQLRATDHYMLDRAIDVCHLPADEQLLVARALSQAFDSLKP